MRLSPEISREVLRPSSFYAVAIMLLAFGVFAGSGAIRGASILLTSFAPLLLLPLAALRATEDRKTGLAGVQATIPTSVRTVFAAKAVSLFLIWLAVMAGAGVVLALLVSSAVTEVWVQIRGLLVWGFLGGVVSLSAGLLVGYLSAGRRVLAVALSASLGLVWLVSSITVGYTPGAQGTGPLRWLSLTGPLAWMPSEIQAARPAPSSLADGNLLAATLLGAAYLGVASWVATGHQTLGGWQEGRGPWRGITAIALILPLIAAPAVAGILEPQHAPRPDAFKLEHHGDQHSFRMGLDPLAEDRPFLIASKEFDARLNLRIYGPPNDTVRIDDLTVTGNGLTFRVDEDFPKTYRLDNVQQDPDRDGGTFGSTSDYIPVTGYTSHAQWPSSVNVTLVADGDTIGFTLGGIKDWDYRKPLSSALGGVLALGTALVGRKATRGLNTW